MTEKISATIQIAATPEHVWAVLADLAGYPQWHPVYREVTGQLVAGSKLTITSTHPVTGREMTARVKVLAAEPATELRWASNVLGISRSERSFTVTPGHDGTLLVQAETYQGLLSRFPAKTRTRIQDAFESINQAIKQQAEARQQASG